MGYLRPTFCSQFNLAFFIPSEKCGAFLVCLLFIKNGFGNNPENGPKSSWIPGELQEFGRKQGESKETAHECDDPKVAVKARVTQPA